MSPYSSDDIESLLGEDLANDQSSADYETPHFRSLWRRHEDLIELIWFKFGKLPDWVERKIRRSDEPALNQWVANFQTAETVEQVFMT